MFEQIGKIEVEKSFIICPQCNGEGYQIDYTTNGHTSFHEKITCSLCKGDRMLIKKVSTLYQNLKTNK